LGANPAVIQLPWGKEDTLRGVIDVIRMQGVLYRDDAKGAAYELVDIPAEFKDAALEARERLVEVVAETDDQLLEKYLAGEAISEQEVREALRRGTIAHRLQPVLCGSAFTNKGVQPLLDAVVEFLPSPSDIPPVQGLEPGSEKPLERLADDKAPF